MAVESATGYHHIGREAQTLGPLLRQVTYDLLGRLGLGEHSFAQTREQGIECREELLRRQTAPLGMPHRLVTFGTTAAHNLRRLGRAGQDGGHPLAVLDNRVGSLAYRLILAQHMQRLGPEPLRGVDTALVSRVVDLPTTAQRVDLVGLLDGRVVLPEDEHGVGVLFEALLECQRRTLLVDEAGGRTRRVEGDTYDILGHLRRYGSQHLAYRSLQHLDIILRMLTVLVDGGVAIFALLPTGVVAHRRSERLAIHGVYQHGTSRVATVVQSDYIFIHGMGRLSV